MFLNSPTLASLRFFEAAARLSSFKQAAAELHVTDGAVSQQIKHLEEAMGCKLFHRLPRGITLTEEGKRFASVVRRALSDIESEARAISMAHSKNEIRIRVGPSFALRWLVPRLNDFYARHPEIKLFIIAEYGYINPEERDFDMAIEMAASETAGLHWEALFPEYLTPVCTPAYLEAHPALSLPEGLNACTLLHDADAWTGGPNDAEWRAWLSGAGVSGVDSAQGKFFSLADMSIQTALNNQGVALGRTALVRDLLDDGVLVAPFSEWIQSPAGYHLVYPKEYADNPGIRIVADWLKEEARKFEAGE
ncbi:MAG: LysR substrate-binding domain-containing protein [Parvularculaceae bacterium]